MTALRRRVAPLLLVAVAVAGCGTAVVPSVPRSASPRPSAAAPSLTPVPGGKPTPVASRPTTTETEFGTIWDGLPASFPKLAGQSQSEIGTDASEMFVVPGTAADAASRMQAELIARGWTVDAGSPLEDGSIVLEATGKPAGCKAEVRLTPPESGIVLMSVYYGVKCPFS